MRLAQITDLHLRQHLFGSPPNNVRRARIMAELFARALRDAKAGGAEFLAITGDLLDVPTWLYGPTWGFQTDDVGPWRDAALADYRLIKQLLDDIGLPYLVLPGNHDWEDVMWRVFDRADHSRVIG